MKGGLGLLAAVGTVGVAEAACAGIVAGTGTVGIWGRDCAYRTWDVSQDPEVFVGVEPVEGRPRGMAYYSGSLYFVGAGSLLDTGPVRYTPGAAGDLSSPTTIRPVVQHSDTARRWLAPHAVAINTSGAGYGAFSGPEPALTTIARDIGGAGSRSITLAVSGSNASPGTPIGFSSISSSSIEYVPSIDRFLSAITVVNPSVTTVYVHPHTAAGLGTPERSFDAIGGINGMDVISGGFASMLLGAPVSQQEVILAFGRNGVGLPDPAFLAVYTLEGVRLGSVANVPLAPLQQASSLAVDETAGVLYLGDSETMTITTLHVPAPGVGAACVGAAVLGARRRRQA